MAGIEVDYKAFVGGLETAMREYDRASEQEVRTYGQSVVSAARALAPVRTGALASSIGLEAGREETGPYIDVGTQERYAVYVEFGTFKDRAQPFMRPALSMAAGATASVGGHVTRSGPRVRSSAKRRTRIP